MKKFENAVRAAAGVVALLIVVPPSAETGEIARQMAPAGFDLVLARDGGAELEAALGPAEFMVCYPNVKMHDAFYRAAPKMRLVQLLSAGYAVRCMARDPGTTNAPSVSHRIIKSRIIDIPRDR